MASVTQRALAKGTALPPLRRGVLRLYSMRFCPFAQRTRIVLNYKNIPYETINVNLKYKPDWFFQRNPLGLVPILEKDSEIVYESAACDDFLDDRYSQKRLTPSDPYVRAQHRALMEMFSQVIGHFYGLLRGTDEREKIFYKLQKILLNYERALNGNFFGGENPAMLDFHIWPWFERMEIFQKHGQNPIPAEKYPKLNSWVTNMLALPAVSVTYFEPHLHEQFFTGLTAGSPNYDIALDARM